MPILAANGQHDVMIPAHRSYVPAQEVSNGPFIRMPGMHLFQYALNFTEEVRRFLA